MPENTRPAFKLLIDIAYVAGFIVAVFLGSLFINAFIFRTFNVMGPSMEPTLFTDQRLIVNKIPVTFDRVRGKQYIPERGQIIVFKNPFFEPGSQEEFIVKRVIGLPGERVVVEDGILTVYNNEHPEGFQPDKEFKGPKAFSSGSVDRTVPEGELFVAGDNREESFSLDSRNGLSTIPLRELQGPVSMRIYPFDQMRLF